MSDDNTDTVSKEFWRQTGAVRQCLEDGVVIWIGDDVILDEGSS